ncbi:winged helix-turn-helix domain-containing protein (plasmid) [Pseudoalteromonas xiamenensis]|uniref:ArsR/SmtB family transcription factor n=1 Tax=Pseudoalteromonas xiamenensis TaxID=882626 RepID=UPI0027E54A78|nr:winged helix-turn-helix domain-containing protein [Pseudoalteromonas xiamenensis]WMN62061.1 winged helix-turn-helix domain-containing protein [Pseudoalteromonas xiamenensis]
MEPNIAYIGNLLGDTARSKMLTALMSGKALTATELSLEADITPQTASSHLLKLVEGELLIVRKQGRHKYFQLKSTEVAELIERMLNISALVSHPRIATGPKNERLRKARICYDHLAGELGVKLFDALVKKGWLIETHTKLTLTATGLEFFSKIGVDFKSLNLSRRPICKACLDWSERRSHLAGSLGEWVLNDALNRQWATQALDSRVIQFTSEGLRAFTKRYGV